MVEPDHSRGPDNGGEPRWTRRLWFVSMTVVALGLWVQLLAPGLAAELQSDDGSGLVALLQLLPLATAVIAVVWRHPSGRLAVFPVSFVPGLAMLSPVEWKALAAPGTLIAAVATFIVYLAVAAGRPDEIVHQPGADIGAARHPAGDVHADSYRQFVAVRFAAMALLFALITYALFFDASIQESLAGLQGEDAAVNQHLFMVVTAYLGWMVAVYMGAVLPSLNWEYHRRRSPIPDAQRRLVADPGRLGRRIQIWLVCLLVVTTVTVWWLV